MKTTDSFMKLPEQLLPENFNCEAFALIFLRFGLAVEGAHFIFVLFCLVLFCFVNACTTSWVSSHSLRGVPEPTFS